MMIDTNQELAVIRDLKVNLSLVLDNKSEFSSGNFQSIATFIEN